MRGMFNIAIGLLVCGRIVVVDTGQIASDDFCVAPDVPFGIKSRFARLTVPFTPVAGDHRYQLQALSPNVVAGTFPVPALIAVDILVRW